MNSESQSAPQYSAYYEPGAGSKYVVRSTLSAIVWTIIAALVIPYIIGLNGGFSWVTILIIILFLIVIFVSIGAARNARTRFTIDNRLAIGVSAEGIALPGRGVIAWDNIVGVRKGGTGVAMGNIWVYVFEVWNGTRRTQTIDVQVKGGIKEIDTLDPKLGPELRATLGGNATRQEPWKGFQISTAYIQGMTQETFNQALHAVTAAAEMRGIPTKW